MAESGAGFLLSGILAGDCPRARTVGINDRCGVNFTQLPDLFMKPR